MDLATERQGGVLVVRVEERRLDAAIAIQFKDALRRTADAGANRVVLDLSDVEFLDSSGLGALVAAMKQLGPGCPLDLAGPQPPVERVLRLTRMDSVFSVFADVQTALRNHAVAG